MVMRASSTERTLALEGCFNFRDLGGYRTATGETIAWRRLFRSDSLHQLTESDDALLDTLGLRTVIDLRTPEEVAEQGPCLHGNLCVSARIRTAPLPPHGAGIQAEASAVAIQYADMLDREVDSLREVIAVLTDASIYPAVLHCTGGHDRSGVVAAVILGMLVVPDDEIVADYAASRHAVISRPPPGGSDPAAPHLLRHGPSMLGVTPEVMRAFLALMRARYGSFGGYASAIDMRGAVRYLRAALVTGPGPD